MTTTIAGEAMELAFAGFPVFPLRAGTKLPAVARWPERASTDAEQVEEWFAGSNANVGVRCGELGEAAIFVVDVDVKDGQPGLNSWQGFVGGHPDLLEAWGATVIADTPSGGLHIYFAVPDGVSVTNRPPRGLPGVDIRGEGGYVVAPPSVTSDGAYRWVQDPWKFEVQLAPPCLIELLTGTPGGVGGTTGRMPPSTPPTSTTDADDTPAEWARRNMDVASILVEGGWVHVGGEQWKRPGKQDRGHSALLHDGDHLVVFSTRCPGEFWRAGRENGDGSRSLSPIEVYAAVHHAGDLSGACRWIRRNRMTPVPSAPSAPPVSSAPPAPPVSSAETGLNLSPEFWEAAGGLGGHIRQAAHSAYVSPDAVLAGVMTRYAANVHPSIVLPQFGSLDLFAIIEGHSGAGKSQAGKAARMLYPGKLTKVLMDRPFGSGEGLVEAFFRWVDEEGRPCSPSKKNAEKELWFQGMHFATDEGVALTTQANRMGSIVIPTLCQAWMGETLGQQNASAERTRIIGPGKVRLTGQINIQTMNGWKLFQDAYASTGLAQRMWCVTALDPEISTESFVTPDWPGELDLPTPSIISGGTHTTLEIASTIVSELHETRKAAHNPDWQGDPLDTHQGLLQLKLAALWALMNGQKSVSGGDWELARLLVSSSINVRSRLILSHTKQQRDARHTAHEQVAEREIHVEDMKHRYLVGRTVEAIQRRIEAEQPLGKKHLSRFQREVYEEAMEVLQAQGAVDKFDAVGRGWSANKRL